MSPSIFFTSSLLILISTSISPVQCTNPDTTASPSPLSLVQTACSNATITIDTGLCLRVLQPIPKVASAKDLYNLTITIIESGISNATNTRKYIEAVLVHYQTADARSEAKGAFEQCKESYGEIISRFSKALQEVKNNGTDYMATTYKLQSACTDCVRTCSMFLAEVGLEDEVVLRGNKVVPIFGMSAISIIRRLHTHSTAASNPNM